MMDNVSRNRFGRLTVELLYGQGHLDPASLNTGHPPVIRPAARLLRCATALRVTAPLGCGSDGWYGRKVPFGFAPQYE